LDRIRRWESFVTKRQEILRNPSHENCEDRVHIPAARIMQMLRDICYWHTGSYYHTGRRYTLNTQSACSAKSRNELIRGLMRATIRAIPTQAMMPAPAPG
jgi:hypothetical protein